MAIQRPYKIVLGLIELFFAIPILGGAIILAHAWTPLGILVLFHLLGVFLSYNEKKSKVGHILGVIGNALAWIPFIGWFVHIIVGITLLIQGITDK
jgi:hypothetical protein